MARNILFSCNLERDLQEKNDSEINNASKLETIERIANDLILKKNNDQILLKKSKKNAIKKIFRVFNDILNVSIF